MRGAITLLVLSVGALLSLGLVTLYSAGLMSKWAAHFLVMQSLWAVLGIAVATAAASMDYRWLKRFHIPWLLLVAAVGLLILVLVIGPKIKGARRWFQLGPVNFQPSELAKLALIILLAYYGERYQRFMKTFWKGLVFPGMLVAGVLALIFIEPDRGMTVLLAAVSGIVLVVAGVRLIYILPPVPLAAAALAYSLWHDEVRWRRILSWLDPETHKQDAGYQVWHSLTALGSGGLQGVGLGNGRQKLGFIPDHHTDFILAVVGEELGLIATLGVMLAFLTLLFCGLQIARRSPDTFGFLLATGITFLITLQAAINVGVVTGALPNKGLPLPFVSYGGSNLLLMMTCVGLLLSIARHAAPESNLFRDEEYGSKRTT